MRGVYNAADVDRWLRKGALHVDLMIRSNSLYMLTLTLPIQFLHLHTEAASQCSDRGIPGNTISHREITANTSLDSLLTYLTKSTTTHTTPSLSMRICVGLRRIRFLGNRRIINIVLDFIAYWLGIAPTSHHYEYFMYYIKDSSLGFPAGGFTAGFDWKEIDWLPGCVSYLLAIIRIQSQLNVVQSNLRSLPLAKWYIGKCR